VVTGHTADVASGRGSWRAIWAGLGLLLAVTPTAGAEPVAELGQGRDPSAVTDATGTLHAVWTALPATPGPAQTLYCRLPAGAAACSPVAFAALPADASPATPHILLRPADGALFAVVTATKANVSTTYAYASGDGGLTWSGPTSVAVGLDALVRAQLSADGAAVELVGSPSSGLAWQRAPLAGPPEARAIPLQNGTRYGFGFAFDLSRLPDGRTFVVAQDPEHHTALRVLGAGDPYQQPSWSGWSAAPSVHGETGPASAGPSGTWLMSHRAARLRVQRWNGSAFAVPRTMGTLAGVGGGDVGPSPGSGTVALQADLAGRVHAAWLPPPSYCGASVCFAYRRSEPYGFGPTFVYPVAPLGGSPPDTLVLAANAGGSGWAVWSDRALSNQGNVRAAALATPPRYSRTGSVVLGHRRRVTLPTRRGCIRPGARFVHRLDLSGLRGGVRPASVRFFFDDGLLPHTDHRAPYRVTYQLPFPALSRHVAAARVTYRSRGRLRHATIGRMIVMCPA
jgi:hypothetical protein